MKLLVVLLLVGIVSVNCLPKHEGGKKEGPGKVQKGKPCQDNEGIDTCVCMDGTCNSLEGCMEVCDPINNPIVSCTCADGQEWTKPEKPGMASSDESEESESEESEEE